MKKEIATKLAPEAIGPYSQGIQSADGFVFLSGQLPIDMNTGALDGDDIVTQTKRSLENIKAILSECGLTLEDVMKTTVFMQNMDDFSEMNNVYAEYFSSPYPARSTIEVAALPKNALVEIELIAKK